MAPSAIGIAIAAFPGSKNEVSDCTVLYGGGGGIACGGADGILVRRCLVSNALVGFAMNSTCKLMDNVTSNCTTKITGNPVLLGVND